MMETQQSTTGRCSRGFGRRRPGTTRAAKRERQRQVLELVTARAIGNQQELVELLAERDVDVTQATVSRDIAELGLVKVAYDGAHIYASPDELAPRSQLPSDERLRRTLADYDVSIGRSGLTLLLVSEAGTAGAIAQAIDDSTLREQEGTLGGDNTILVLFADEGRLETWRDRFEQLQAEASAAGVPR
jgi:transcriptional regulator of arginine metabolism